MYNLEIREHLYTVFKKLSKKNPKQLSIINKKIQQILKNPHYFKPLKFPMRNLRRVHVDKSFVLVFAIDESRKSVIIWDYDHHDRIYKK